MWIASLASHVIWEGSLSIMLKSSIEGRGWWKSLQCKDHLDVAISTSIGQLHKYISKLMGSGLNWDMIKTMIQERFSECGSSITA